MDKSRLFDQERREMAKDYNRRSKRNNVIHMIFGLILLGIFFGFSLEEEAYQFFSGWTGNWDLQLASYIAGLFVIYSALGWILDFMLDYKLAREYELSNQEPGEWFADKIKGAILSLILLYGMARLIFTLMELQPELWWASFSVIGIFFVLLINFLFPVVLFPLFFKLEPYPDTPLRERLENLFEKADVKVADIYEFDLSSKTNSANAAVMGMGKTRKIILGDNLKDKYTNEEIEAVMAHEIGHHANGDIFKFLIIQFATLVFTSFIVSLFWQPVTNWMGYESISAIYALPLLLLSFGVVNMVITPFQLWLERKFEKKADIYAIKLIDEPKDLATAFAKLADDSLAELQYSSYKLLFKASHPPIGNRVDLALEWADKE